MKKGKIGVQMMMLKDKVQSLGVYETMKALHDLGFSAVEVSQIPMTEENVSELRRASMDFDIEIAALSAALEPMLPGSAGECLVNDFDKIVKDCKTLNCKYLRIGILPLNLIGSKEKILEFVQKAEAMAQRLEREGISLYYHNHHLELQKFEGEYLLDIIKHNTRSLGFELDVHWLQRGGVNPVRFIMEYAGRISLLHLKDYRIGTMKLEALKTGDMRKFMEAFTNIIEFAELGEGNLDLKEIINTALHCGTQYFFIEQDEQYGRDPFDSLKISKDNLIKLGYEQWL